MTTIPKKWKVRITKSNRKVLEQWRIKQPNVDQDPKITCLNSNALRGWLISGKDGWDDSYMDWGDGYGYEEITFEEFKKHILMEQQEIKFKPIAMKCNQEQFNAIKPILEKHGLDISGVWGGFDAFSFLTNHYNYRELHIGNVPFSDPSRPPVEDGEWNQDLFLRCCGIDPNPKFEVGDKVIIKKGSVGYGTGGWRGEFQNIIQTQGYLTVSEEYTKEDGTQTVYFEESIYQADSTWLTLYTETKTKMKTYLTKISDLKKIHDVACSSWKTKIKALIVDPFADYVVLTQQQVDEMFKAATPKQRPVLVEVFGEPVTQCPYKEGQLLWMWDFESIFPSVRKFLGMDGSKFKARTNTGDGTTTWDCAAPFNNGQLPDQFKHLLV